MSSFSAAIKPLRLVMGCLTMPINYLQKLFQSWKMSSEHYCRITASLWNPIVFLIAFLIL
uniref:Uncharacterized protein n=1 Tax=Rhizophora mucronata TaxID=61149 RepID=A0A2P2KNV6_RHIMU